MSFAELFGVFRNGWRRILTGLVVGVALGLVAAFVTPPRYAATAAVVVSVKSAPSVAELQQGEVFAEARARTYAGLAESGLVQDRVTQTLGAAGTDRAVVAQAQPQTSIISIEVRADSAGAARDGANATVEALGEVARTVDGGGSSPVVLTPMTLAQDLGVVVSPRKGLYGVLGLLLGAAIGFVWAVLGVQAAQPGAAGRRRGSAD